MSGPIKTKIYKKPLQIKDYDNWVDDSSQFETEDIYPIYIPLRRVVRKYHQNLPRTQKQTWNLRVKIRQYT